MVEIQRFSVSTVEFGAHRQKKDLRTSCKCGIIFEDESVMYRSSYIIQYLTGKEDL